MFKTDPNYDEVDRKAIAIGIPLFILPILLVKFLWSISNLLGAAAGIVLIILGLMGLIHTASWLGGVADHAKDALD